MRKSGLKAGLRHYEAHESAKIPLLGDAGCDVRVAPVDHLLRTRDIERFPVFAHGKVPGCFCRTFCLLQIKQRIVDPGAFFASCGCFGRKIDARGG